VEGDSRKIGKPVGNDLAQGILTLPAIMLLERYPNNNPINDLFEDSDKSAPHLSQVLSMIQRSGIIGECYQVVRDYCNKALSAIELLEKDEIYASLVDLAHYVTDRNH
jgi:octaprenyl-diphosphate synthase